MQKTSIIIVTDSNIKMKKMGHQLRNMIGQLTDKEAALWDEKHYKDNEPALTSSQKIIFIGETNTSKMLYDSIVIKYDHLNMKIGWLGNSAVICVKRDNLLRKDYNEFRSLFKTQSKEIRTGAFFETLKKADTWVTNQKVGVKIVGLLIPYVWPVAAYALVKGHIKGSIDSKKITQQQYSYVLNKFMSNYLSDFIGTSE